MTDQLTTGLEGAERVISLCDALAELTPSDFEAFAADRRTQWAVEMGLIRIGEAVSRIGRGVLARFPDQPWRQIVALRDLAAHQRDDLDPQRAWRTLTRDVPALRGYLVDTLLAELQATSPSSVDSALPRP